MNYSKIFLSAVCLAISSIGLAANSSIEVSQSVPLETTLGISGIQETSQVWLQMISKAKASIDLEEFYIAEGPALQPILAEIKAAAARGVKIRFLVDSKFFKNYPDAPQALAQTAGISVRKIDFGAGVQHSKFMIVDQKEVFVGSANFDWLALSHIHEVGLRIQSEPVSAKLGSVFQKDWSAGVALPGSDSGEDEENPGDEDARRRLGASAPAAVPSEIQLLASPPSLTPNGVGDSLTAITQLLTNARKSIQIQVYQYNTRGKGGKWTVLNSAIQKAAARGVKVQLLVDKVALKTGSTDLKALAKTQNIEVRTVLIPEWSGGALQYARLIHSKYLLVDGASAWVGTENWSQDYFTQSRNVGVILKTPEVADKLGQIFERVWNSSYAKALE